MHHRQLLITRTALILSILLYTCTIALIQPSVASAHAYVIGSNPVDGSTVANVPKDVHISFNTAISPLSSAHVYFIEGGNLVNVGATPSQVVPFHAQEIIIPLKASNTQPKGSYEVTWTAVANDDGHTTYGIIGFNVGFSGLPLTGSPILGPSTSNDLQGIQNLDFTALLTILWEWLVFVALTTWIGILVMEQLVLKDGGHHTVLFAQRNKHSYSLQQLCLATLLLGESIELFLRVVHLMQVQQSNDFPLAWSYKMIMETNYGHIWLLRMVLIALAMGGLYWTYRSRKNTSIAASAQASASADPQCSQSTSETLRIATHQTDDTSTQQATRPAQPVSSRPSTAWLLLGGLLTLLFVLTSPAAQVLQPHLSVILFDWLKSIAQGIWLGSIAYVSSLLLPLLGAKHRDDDAIMLAPLLQRLTPFLLTSIGIQLVSLFFLSDTSLHSPQQLLTDPYERTQVVQLIITGIAVLLSAYILFVLRLKILRQEQFLPTLKGEGSDRQSNLSALRRMKHHLQVATLLLSLLGAAILLCSALLSFFAPPIVFPDVTYTNQPDVQTNAVNTQTKHMGSFSVTLELLPGRVGEVNTVIMLINDKNGKSVNDAQVRITANMQIMDMGTGHALITGGNPAYATTFNRGEAFSMAGLWIITVDIQRPSQPAAQGTFQVIVS